MRRTETIWIPILSAIILSLAASAIMTTPEGLFVDSAGRYMVGEGHHRMQAAIQSGSKYVQKLIDNGRWTQVTSFPSKPVPMPPINQ